MFLSKYGKERSETCINVRFRSWNAILYISQVFHHHILIEKKNKNLTNIFLKNQNLMGKIWDTHKRAFHDLKRTIMHVSSIPSPYFDKKSTILKIGCFYPNMVRENLRHPWTCVSGPETHVYACCRSSLTIFWLKN